MVRLLSQIKPKRSLGQNFLIDDNIARKIVQESGISNKDIILEIGAGQGTLTRYLVDKGKHIIAIETDDRLIENLQMQFSGEKVTILHKDVLDVSFTELSKKYQSPLQIVGNIPYHLTSSILFKIFDEHAVIQSITLMVQLEVAKRIVAKEGTKEYGILSVISQFYGKPKILFKVSPNCFYPKPKVTSAIIKIDMFESLPVEIDKNLFTLVVKTVFGKRRKTIRNSLKYLPYDEGIIYSILNEIKFPFDKRPEDFSVNKFVTLVQKIQQFVS